MIDESPLHTLWSKAKGQPGYDKAEWLDLQAKLIKGQIALAAKAPGRIVHYDSGIMGVRVFDLDTGQEITNVRWASEPDGLCETIEVTKTGIVVTRRTGRLKIVLPGEEPPFIKQPPRCLHTFQGDGRCLACGAFCNSAGEAFDPQPEPPADTPIERTNHGLH